MRQAWTSLASSALCSSTHEGRGADPLALAVEDLDVRHVDSDPDRLPGFPVMGGFEPDEEVHATVRATVFGCWLSHLAGARPAGAVAVRAEAAGAESSWCAADRVQVYRAEPHLNTRMPFVSLVIKRVDLAVKLPVGSVRTGRHQDFWPDPDDNGLAVVGGEGFRSRIVPP